MESLDLEIKMPVDTVWSPHILQRILSKKMGLIIRDDNVLW